MRHPHCVKGSGRCHPYLRWQWLENLKECILSCTSKLLDCDYTLPDNQSTIYIRFINSYLIITIHRTLELTRINEIAIQDNQPSSSLCIYSFISCPSWDTGLVMELVCWHKGWFGCQYSASALACGKRAEEWKVLFPGKGSNVTMAACFSHSANVFSHQPCSAETWEVLGGKEGKWVVAWGNGWQCSDPLHLACLLSRLKCPYCPVEQNPAEAVQIFF